MIITILTFIVNFIVVAFILSLVQEVIPFQHPVILWVMSFMGKPATMANITMVLSASILIISFLLAHTRPMQYILLKTMGCRSPKGDEKEYLDEIMTVLCRQMGKNPSDYHVYVRDDKALNAFALGHDNICVFTSLLYNFSAAEVAGILAHEMGHLEHRDTAYGIGIAGISWAGNMVVSIYLFILRLVSILAIIPVIGWVIVIAVWLIQIQIYFLQIILNLPLQLLSLFSGRKQEYAADQYACEIGLGRELYSALSKIMVYSGEKRMGFFSSLYSTHPATSKRLKRIETYYETH